jgi:hypothetical protein
MADAQGSHGCRAGKDAEPALQNVHSPSKAGGKGGRAGEEAGTLQAHFLPVCLCCASYTIPKDPLPSTLVLMT